MLSLRDQAAWYGEPDHDCQTQDGHVARLGLVHLLQARQAHSAHHGRCEEEQTAPCRKTGVAGYFDAWDILSSAKISRLNCSSFEILDLCVF